MKKTRASGRSAADIHCEVTVVLDLLQTKGTLDLSISFLYKISKSLFKSVYSMHDPFINTFEPVTR